MRRFTILCMALLPFLLPARAIAAEAAQAPAMQTEQLDGQQKQALGEAMKELQENPSKAARALTAKDTTPFPGPVVPPEAPAARQSGGAGAKAASDSSRPSGAGKVIYGDIIIHK